MKWTHRHAHDLLVGHSDHAVVGYGVLHRPSPTGGLGQDPQLDQRLPILLRRRVPQLGDQSRWDLERDDLAPGGGAEGGRQEDHLLHVEEWLLQDVRPIAMGWWVLLVAVAGGGHPVGLSGSGREAWGIELVDGARVAGSRKILTHFPRSITR